MDTLETDIDLLGHFIHAMRNALRVAVIRTREVANESHPSRAKQKAALAYAACQDAEATLKKAQFLWEMKTRSLLPTKERVSLRALADTISQTADILGDVFPKKNPLILDIQALSAAENLCIEANLDLLGQAIWHVAENALRYSFAREPIVVKAVIVRSRELKISVTSRGLEILPAEIDKCAQLGWRGRNAELVNSGQGLGLWVVARIMEIHGGRLRLSSTKGVTTASLVIPLH